MKKIDLGYIGVDSGTIWIGDPSYVMFKNEITGYGNDLGQNWKEFTEKLDLNKQVQDFSGLGKLISTVHGDGLYQVHGNLDKKGNISSITISLK